MPTKRRAPAVWRRTMLLVAALTAVIVTTTPAPALAQTSFQESDTGGDAQPDWLEPSSADWESFADAPSASMSNSANARSSGPVGTRVFSPIVGQHSAGRSWANGFSQLSTFPDLAPGEYTARARIQIEDLDLRRDVREPVLPSLRSADAYAYLVITASSDTGFAFSRIDLRDGAAATQNMTLAFRVEEGDGQLHVSCALGTVAESRGDAESVARAAVVVTDFAIESVP